MSLSLWMSGNGQISDSSLRSISKSCPDLRHLYVVDCHLITDTSLKALMTSRLTVLNIADCVRYVSVTQLGVLNLCHTISQYSRWFITKLCWIYVQIKLDNNLSKIKNTKTNYGKQKVIYVSWILHTGSKD